MKKAKRGLAFILSIFLLVGCVEPAASAAAFSQLKSSGEPVVYGIAQSGTCGETATWELSDEGVLTISGSGAISDTGEHDMPWKDLRNDITSIVIDEGITRIGNWVFHSCTEAISVSLPSTLKEIGEQSFRSCSKITQVMLPSGLESIGGGAFYYCDSLTSLTIPGGVENFTDAFGSSGLRTLVLEEGIDSVDDYAFYGCYHLKNVTLPSTVKRIGKYAFSNCSSLANLDIPADVTELGEAALSYTALSEFEFPEGVNSVEPYVLSGTDITSIVIPDRVTEIGDYAFLNCTQLKNITFSKNLIDIGTRAFAYTALTQVDLPDGLETLGDSAFYDCNELTSVTMTDSVQVMEKGVFSDCDDLRSVVLSDYITEIGHQSFSLCKKLESVNIPASLKTIGNDAFQYCESLRSVTLPEGVERIGSLAFRGCGALEAVVLPASVKEISGGYGNDAAFNSCGNVTLYVKAGSYAQQYAIDGNLRYELLAEGKRVTLDVLDSSGTLLEKGYSVRWYQENRLIATGNSVVVDLDTQVLTYEVVLDEHMLFQYQVPAMQQVELVENITQADCQLQALPVVTLTGAVTDAEGEPLPQASVTISQSAGIYEKTQRENLPVNSDGSFSIQLPVLETTVTAEMDGYYTRSRTVSLLDGEGTSNNVGNIALPAIPEARVELSFTVESAVAADEASVTTKLQTGNGITVSAYNMTTGKELTNAVFQYPYLVLGDNNAKSGDEVRITATDTWGKMTAKPVTVKLTDDPWTAAITFTENGAVSALLSGDFPKRAAVFDAGGNLVQTATVDGQLFTSQPLPAGNYQVAFLEKTSQISAIPTLGYLTTLGLVQGENYVLRSFSVENGKITTLGTVTVPELEMSYLAAESTSVSVNKAKAPAGQYVTVRAAYELDEKVSSTGQTLVVDLPEGCSLVKNSVTVDGDSANYSSPDDGTVRILTNKEKATVLFYVAAQSSGEFSVTCSLEFTPAGTDEKVTQPLGSGFFSATAMELRVLDKTSKKTVRVSGKAAPNGTVEIYDGSRLAETATANAAGTWFAIVDLQPRYQFEVHDLQAKVTTGGTETLSDVARVTYDANYIDLASITMINTAHPPTNLNPMEYVTEMVAADYQGKSFYYRWDPNHPVFTFTVEFDENDPERLSGVTVVAANAQGEETLLPCQYQASAGAWTTSGTFDTVESLPVSLSVRYSCDGVPSVFGGGEEAVDAMMTAIVEDTQEYQEAVEQVMEQESAKLSLGTVTAGEGGAFSMPLLYDEKQIGTYAAEEVNYTQFDLNAWREQSTVIEYTLEDGSCYYTRRELSGGEGTVTITQWTAYPADKVLTKETITLSGTVSPVLRLSQGERLAASRSAQTLSSPRLAADWSDLFEITNTIAQLLPSWAGSLASGINTISDVNILRMGVDSNMSIFELDYNNVLELLDEKCDDGTPRVSSKQRTIFLEQLDELNDTVLEYPGMVFTAYAMSYFADYVVGKTIGDLVPEEISDLADSENINTIYSSLEGFQRLMMKLGKKDGVKLSGRGVDMVVGVTTGLVEFDTNVVTSMVSDATKNVLQLNLDAQEYMDRRFQEIHGDFQDLMKQIQLSYGECKDDEEEDGKEDGGNGDGGDGRNGANSLSFDMTAGLDPSGYVCEAVPSNVLEGVTVTLYKMGDGGTEEEWDAANYDQTNPVTTNADGVYAWDVPAGKWKVKFEKEGYETDCSDWLAVPPPQTNVNVSLVSEASPEIASVSAYPEGVRVEFSQYMDIESVKEELSVTTNGNAITGSVEAENAEGSLDNPEIKYASVFFFTFGESVESGTVTVSAAGAENYAENTVQETAESKTATIEVKPTGIAVQETASVGCDGTVTLELRVEPPAAGANKTIQVASSTSYLFEVKQNNATVTQVTTDEEGKATLTLSGKLPGVGQLTFSLDGTSLTAATQVAVGDTTEVLSACAEVTANPVPGSVAPGKEVTLQTETAGAVIYYTLNKTCPCDLDNEARKEYTGPIEITEDTYIIAYAVKEGFADSETSHFSYTVQEETPPVVGPGPGPDTGDTLPFTDVPQGAWYRAAVEYVYLHDLMRGVSETEFSPNTRLTRGQVAQILYNLEGKPLVSKKTTFTDVQGHWASGPIAWAEDAGVVAGYQNKTYRPENYVTREELAQMLYNYAKYKKYDLAALGDLDQFPDGDLVQGWAEDAVAWANGNGLINGFEDDTLRPQGDSTRAQAASILMNFDQNVVE